MDVSLYDERNAEYLTLIKGWLKHAKTVYVWKGLPKSVILPTGGHTAQALHIKVLCITVRAYRRSCRTTMFVVAESLYAFMQELAELGVRGYFAEGWGYPGADMADLRVFLAGRMTFNATLDIDTLVTEFLDNYYGGGVVRIQIR